MCSGPRKRRFPCPFQDNGEWPRKWFALPPIAWLKTRWEWPRKWFALPPHVQWTPGLALSAQHIASVWPYRVTAVVRAPCGLFVLCICLLSFVFLFCPTVNPQLKGSDPGNGFALPAVVVLYAAYIPRDELPVWCEKRSTGSSFFLLPTCGLCCELSNRLPK